MKQKLFLSIVVIFFGLSGHAQTEFGVTGGLNVANIVGDTGDADLESLFAFNGGVFSSITMTKQFSIQPELRYSMQGSTFDEEEELKNIFNYIQLPVKLKYLPTENFHVYVGPQLGYGVTFEQELGEQNEDVSEFVKDFDFGAVVGADFISDSGFGGGLGYNLGLTNFLEDEEEDNAFNSVFNVNLIYQFQQ